MNSQETSQPSIAEAIVMIEKALGLSLLCDENFTKGIRRYHVMSPTGVVLFDIDLLVDKNQRVKSIGGCLWTFDFRGLSANLLGQ